MMQKPDYCFFCGNMIKEEDPIKCRFSIGSWSGNVFMLCCKQCATDRIEVEARRSFWIRLKQSGNLDKIMKETEEEIGGKK